MYETYLPSPSLKALVQHVVNAWLHISPTVVISCGGHMTCMRRTYHLPH